VLFLYLTVLLRQAPIFSSFIRTVFQSIGRGKRSCSGISGRTGAVKQSLVGVVAALLNFMAEFLDTTAISQNIETLLESARERVVLISPYLKLREKIRELLEDATLRDVAVTIVYGKRKRCDEIERLKAIAGIKLGFCKNVHSKCYLNEHVGIITSLNLHEFSEAENREMGVFFSRENDSELFQRTFDEAERTIRLSETLHDTKPARSFALKTTTGAFKKLSTAKLAKQIGLQTRILTEKLIGHGYLELRQGDKPYLTRKGRGVGGEFRFGKGPCVIWPPNLKI
jgi:phosphatidylserine/phosphatidylglycerophosphate/cardiolipin synthase-like enzyme